MENPIKLNYCNHCRSLNTILFRFDNSTDKNYIIQCNDCNKFTNIKLFSCKGNECTEIVLVTQKITDIVTFKITEETQTYYCYSCKHFYVDLCNHIWIRNNRRSSNLKCTKCNKIKVASSINNNLFLDPISELFYK
jgi:hypothetical protein